MSEDEDHLASARIDWSDHLASAQPRRAGFVHNLVDGGFDWSIVWLLAAMVALLGVAVVTRAYEHGEFWFGLVFTALLLRL